MPVVTVVTLVPFLLVSPAAGRDLAVHSLLGAERPAPLPPTAALRGRVYSRFTDEETEAQRRFHRVWPTLVATVLASILSPPSSRRSAPQACFWEGRPIHRGLAPGAGQSRPSALRAGGGEVAAVLALAVLPGRGLSSHGAPGTEAPAFGWWDEAQGGSPGRQAHRDAWWRAVAGAEGQGLGRRWRGEPGRCPRHRGRGAGVPGPPGEVGDSDRE